MANFVTNIVHFQGDPERIVDLRGAVQDDQYGMSGIDFNKIIPMPSGLWMGGINPDTRAKYGKNNWLDWSVANWGTKWNAFRFDEAVNATHAELCYFLDRIRLNPNFLESRCQSAGSSDFSFDWSPGELFGQQLGS